MEEQLQNKQRYKRLCRKHFVIAIIAIFTLFFFTVGTIIWILNIENIIQGPWAKVLPIIFTVLSVALPFFVWLFSISSDKAEQLVTSAIQPIPSNSSLTDTNPHRSSIELSASAGSNVNYQDQGPLSKAERSNLGIVQVRHNAVFLFNEPLTDHSEFYGRVRERRTLITRTNKGASTSIVGPRRIGKTWLMSYLRLVAPVELGTNFKIAFLDATSSSCSTVTDFTAKVLNEFGIHILVHDHTNLELAMLEKVVQDLKAKDQNPVLCIDEFEGFGNHQAFDLSFFAGLRAMTQVGLCLVAASKKPLIDIVGDYGKTSGFFNIFEQLMLKPFNIKEAEAFTLSKSLQAGFTDQERAYLLKYGQKEDQQWLPLRLQLVGKLLMEDKILAAEEDPHYYRPDDPTYWREFEERLEEKYLVVVR